MRLSEQAVLDYRERGYLVPPYRLEPDLLQSVQQALDQLIDQEESQASRDRHP